MHQRIINNPSGSGKFADVLTIKFHASGDESSHAIPYKNIIILKNQVVIIFSKASFSSRDYIAIANDILSTVVNWEHLNRSNLALAELLTAVNLGAGSSFKLPSSWGTNFLSENRMVVEHNVDDISYGAINLYFYRYSVCHSAEDMFNRCTAHFRQQDVGITLVTNELEIIPDDFNSELQIDFYSCTGEINSMNENMRDFYQVYIFIKKGLWCYIELVGRHRNQKNYRFEGSKRCMEIILSTMKIVAS